MPYKEPPKEHQFKPGEVANPNGRPKGLSITALVREELEKVPEGQKEKAKDLLVKRILHKAISEGDRELIKVCWQYMDGMPPQSLKISGDQEQPPVRVEHVHPEDNAGIREELPKQSQTGS